MEKEELFKVYEIISMSTKKPLAYFTNEKEANKTLEWLNTEIFKHEFAKLKITSINNENYLSYDFTNSSGLVFVSFLEFKAFLEKRIDNKNAFYKLNNKENRAFVKINDCWWQFDFSTPLNDATVCNYFGGKQTGLELSSEDIVECKDWCDLDWNGTYIYDNTYRTGWLAPDGTFYGCNYEAHSLQARFVHKSYESQLEQSGWIKIARDLEKYSEVRALLSRNEKSEIIVPTPRQMEFLQKSDINNYDYIEYMVKFRFSNLSQEM